MTKTEPGGVGMETEMVMWGVNMEVGVWWLNQTVGHDGTVRWR